MSVKIVILEKEEDSSIARLQRKALEGFDVTEYTDEGTFFSALEAASPGYVLAIVHTACLARSIKPMGLVDCYRNVHWLFMSNDYRGVVYDGAYTLMEKDICSNTANFREKVQGILDTRWPGEVTEALVR